jgi:hypothetical protein
LQRDPKSLLWDAREAAEVIAAVTAGKATGVEIGLGAGHEEGAGVMQDVEALEASRGFRPIRPRFSRTLVIETSSSGAPRPASACRLRL